MSDIRRELNRIRKMISKNHPAGLEIDLLLSREKKPHGNPVIINGNLYRVANQDSVEALRKRNEKKGRK